jgi:hypothetical protein
VVVDVGLRRGDALDRAGLVAEVGREDLDRRVGRALADRRDAAHEVVGAAVREVVAVDRRDHDVAQAELGDRLGEPRGLVRVDAVGQARGDVAERARARAHRAEHHHRRVSLRPALVQVRARRLLADGAELTRRKSARVSTSRASRARARAATAAWPAPEQRSRQVTGCGT